MFTCAIYNLVCIRLWIFLSFLPFIQNASHVIVVVRYLSFQHNHKWKDQPFQHAIGSWTVLFLTCSPYMPTGAQIITCDLYMSPVMFNMAVIYMWALGLSVPHLLVLRDSAVFFLPLTDRLLPRKEVRQQGGGPHPGQVLLQGRQLNTHRESSERLPNLHCPTPKHSATPHFYCPTHKKQC